MEIRRIVDGEENHARLSRILDRVLSCDSIVRSALGVRTEKKKSTTADKGRVRMTGTLKKVMGQ